MKILKTDSAPEHPWNCRSLMCSASFMLWFSFMTVTCFSQSDTKVMREVFRINDLPASPSSVPGVQVLKSLSSQSPYFVPTYDQNTSPYCLFTALSQARQTTLYIFAPNGEPLFYKIVDTLCYDFKVQPNGYFSYFQEDIGGFVIMDSILNVVDTIRAKNIPTDFHDFRMNPDGSCFLFGVDRRIIDMSALVDGGDKNATVIGMVVEKLDSMKNLVFEWNSFDHFNITDSYDNLMYSFIDYVHFNSLEQDTDSSIILSSRKMNELTRINLNTGDIIWRLGGKNNQFVLRNFDRAFSGQHSVRKRNDSTFTIYDNGLELVPIYSMGVEFSLDQDSLVARELREFRHNPDVYAPIMGNVQNLPDGNTLVNWGGNSFTEYNPQLEVVHEGEFLNSEIPAYTVYKYGWKNPLFSTDKDSLDFGSVRTDTFVSQTLVIHNHLNEELVLNGFTTSDPFETSLDTLRILPDEDAELVVTFRPEEKAIFHDTLTIRSYNGNQGSAIQVELMGSGSGGSDFIPQESSSPVSIYPVPFNRVIHYRADKAVERIEIVDMNGRTVLVDYSMKTNGSLNTGNLKHGCYIISIYYKDKTRTDSLIMK